MRQNRVVCVQCTLVSIILRVQTVETSVRLSGHEGICWLVLLRPLRASTTTPTTTTRTTTTTMMFACPPDGDLHARTCRTFARKVCVCVFVVFGLWYGGMVLVILVMFYVCYTQTQLHILPCVSGELLSCMHTFWCVHTHIFGIYLHHRTEALKSNGARLAVDVAVAVVSVVFVARCNCSMLPARSMVYEKEGKKNMNMQRTIRVHIHNDGTFARHACRSENIQTYHNTIANKRDRTDIKLFYFVSVSMRIFCIP